MIDIDKLLTLGVFAKWLEGEPMSTKDFERLITVFEHCPLQADMPDQARWAALQVKFRSVLHEKYIPKQGG